MERLTGRRLLVVGAGTQASEDPDAPPGNGRAIAVQASLEGADVACADIDEGAALRTVELVSAAGGRAVAVAGDAADPDDCAAMVSSALAELGGLDAIAVNVGIGVGAGLAGTSVE